jgi:sigma-B regulation protein RsbU (phosphoserine phosphatase)
MRASLGVKLTLTSTLLVTVVVAFLGYIHATSIRTEHERWASERATAYRAEADRLAASASSVLAVAVSEHLQGNELEPLDLVARQLIRRDERVVSVRIANQRGEILADSAGRVDARHLQTLDPAPAPSQTESERDGRHILIQRQPIPDPNAASAPNAPSPATPPIGLIEFVYDLSPLGAQLDTIETQRQEAVSRSLAFTLQIGLAAIILGAFLSLLQGLRYARPIRRLAQTTTRLANGDLSARVAVVQSDEVGALGHQFNHMADRLQVLLHESVSKAELEHELTLARSIQSALVPRPGTHLGPGLEVAGYYEPASNVGGDFWDFSTLPRGRSAVLIGDVTGHGVPASILTATAKGAIDTLRQVHGGDLQVAETMRVLDRVIHEAGHGAYFMTATAAVFDPAESALAYSAAAHPPALLLRWTESGVRVSRLAARGNRLGDGDASGFEAKRVRVERGDVLVWYTDGLVDATNPEGAAYSTRHLIHVLSHLPPETPAEAIVERLADDVRTFRQGAPLPDDVTFVVGRVA